MAEPSIRSPFRHTLIFGSGIMGREIARTHLSAGIPVSLFDLSESAVQQAAIDLSRLTTSVPDVTSAMDSLRDLPGAICSSSEGELEGFGCSLEPLSQSEVHDTHGSLVIETIVEQLQAKRTLLRQLERILDDRTTFTSNTSSLQIAAIAEGLQSARRIFGLHFFMPVPQRPLVEVIPHALSEPQTLAALQEHVSAIRKDPLVAPDSPGFIVNRILWPYLNSAVRLLELGASASQIEAAALAIGMPLSPLHLIDIIGLRTAFDAGRVAWQAFPDRMDPSPILPKLIKLKQLGRHAGSGFYAYQGNERLGTELADTALSVVANYQRELETWDAASVQLNLLVPMLIEAAIMLQDDVVQSAEQLHFAMCGGLGFQPSPSLFEQAAMHGTGRDRPIHATLPRPFQSDIAAQHGTSPSDAQAVRLNLVQQRAESRLTPQVLSLVPGLHLLLQS